MVSNSNKQTLGRKKILNQDIKGIPIRKCILDSISSFRDQVGTLTKMLLHAGRTKFENFLNLRVIQHLEI